MCIVFCVRKEGDVELHALDPEHGEVRAEVVRPDKEREDARPKREV